MTHYELLVSLRQRLLDAEKDENRRLAEELFSTLNIMCEISYEKQNEALTSLIVDLADAARDVAMAVKGKSEIPSVQEIQAIFPPIEKASQANPASSVDSPQKISHLRSFILK